MHDSWRDRIEQDKDLLSLGHHQKTLSFSGDGGGGGQQLPWNGSDSLITETSNGSSSSAVISPSNGPAEEKVSCEDSDQSGCVLKEHDYIGMADISSAASAQSQPDSDDSQELNFKETDLCLGLGLGLAPSSQAEPVEDIGKTIAFTFSQQESVTKIAVDQALTVNTAKYNATVQKSLQTSWPNAPVKTITVDSSSLSKANGDFQPPHIGLSIKDFGSNKAGAPHVATVFPGACVVPPPALKNGVKRGYTEAMSDAASRFNMASEAPVVVKNGDADDKAQSKHSQNSFLPGWAPANKSISLTPWHVALEQSASHPFCASKPTPVVTPPRVDKPVVDCAATAYKGSRNQSETVHDSAMNEAPPPKGQVVGWPPIRSYRKSALSKASEMFVKVNMDGVTVGRKVDLNAHNSYEGLLSALEDMFQPSNTAQGGSQAAHGNDIKQFRLLNGSDYVLTYEDKDGDWMLVGDVPWSMFTNTVRRLRITRIPEATGLGPRGSEKLK